MGEYGSVPYEQCICNVTGSIKKVCPCRITMVLRLSMRRYLTGIGKNFHCGLEAAFLCKAEGKERYLQSPPLEYAYTEV